MRHFCTSSTGQQAVSRHSLPDFPDSGLIRRILAVHVLLVSRQVYAHFRAFRLVLNSKLDPV